jgi:hypothetical protein
LGVVAANERWNIEPFWVSMGETQIKHNQHVEVS